MVFNKNATHLHKFFLSVLPVTNTKYILLGLVITLYLIFYMLSIEKNTNSFLLMTKQVSEIYEIGKLRDSNLYANNGRRRTFFVFNQNCKIPYVNPFTPELWNIYDPPKFETCSNDSDLITPIFDDKRKRYILHINENVAIKLLNSSTAEYNCYYQEIVRSKEHDSNADPLPRRYFSQDFEVPVHVENMIVECHRLENVTDVLQRDAFLLIQHKFETGKLTHTKGPRKPSVIMFGIDSLSRINFRRTMPKLFEFLNRRGWYEMQGYNKVADNTFPNLLAILSGFSPESAEQVCNLEERGCFDRFPFIWKYFKNADYLTAYAEDESGIGTFNYVKPGFVEPPVDYYFRTFLTAIEEHLKIYKCKSCTMSYCIGRRLTSSYVYDMCRLFMQRFLNVQPIFGLFWSNSFSHDDYEMPAMLSDKILQYFLDFETDGVFNSSIMIFFSDHGFRFGGPVYLNEGFLEERLPTLFIWLPNWFRQKYPEYAYALQMNRNRLSSNYDLYMTLKHIIELGAAGELQLPPAVHCPKCQSLFYVLPENRTCADAAINDHWCTCYPFEVVPDEMYGSRIVPKIIDRINEYIIDKNLHKLCTNLSLSYIHLGEYKLNLTASGEKVFNELGIYRMKFKVKPNSADFQATVLFNNRTEELTLDVETISRLNSYKEDSPCVDDKEAKKFCICYDNIEKD